MASDNLNNIFDKIDADGSGVLSCDELRAALLEVRLQEHTVKEIINEADSNNNGSIERDEFLAAMSKVSQSSSDTRLQALVKKQAALLQVKGKGGAHHTYSTEEVFAFASHLNHVLSENEKLADYFPIDPNSNDLFEKLKDGVILAHFVNCVKENTIDLRVLNYPKNGKLSVFKVGENLNLGIKSAASVGVKVIGIGAEDIRDGENPTLALGLLWQMVKMHLLADINLKSHPELIRLLEDGESLEDLLKLSAEEILLRWMNYHLRESGSNKRIQNFSGDVKDSEAYTRVMNHIDPNSCGTQALQINDKNKRAKMVLDNAKNLGCHPFIKASDITAGNSKLNLAFTADLFNTRPGLDPVAEEELNQLGILDDDMEGNREERAFRLWCNTLGIEDFYLNNLFDDFEDGLNLLKVIDAIEPNTVSWKKVEKKPRMVFKKNANNSYAIVLGKGKPFNCSLVGIGGGDITTKNKKLVLGFVWQLFRFHSLKFVASLGGKAKEIEGKVLGWANQQVTQVGGVAANNFRDKNVLESGRWYCQLTKAINPKVVNDDLILDGSNDDDALMNCRYAISVARQQDATIFCLPEDLQEVKPKMVLTFVASIMNRCGVQASDLTEY